MLTRWHHVSAEDLHPLCFRRVSRSQPSGPLRTVGKFKAPALVKRPKEKFYNLRMSKNEGPYLCRDGVTLTNDVRMAWLGNDKAVVYARRTFAIAFVMVAVPKQPWSAQ